MVGLSLDHAARMPDTLPDSRWGGREAKHTLFEVVNTSGNLNMSRGIWVVMVSVSLEMIKWESFWWDRVRRSWGAPPLLLILVSSSSSSSSSSSTYQQWFWVEAALAGSGCLHRTEYLILCGCTSLVYSDRKSPVGEVTRAPRGQLLSGDGGLGARVCNRRCGSFISKPLCNAYYESSGILGDPLIPV
ncbi:hypothetical protein Tco_1321164 [Tanacetum coccineum]